MNQVVRILQLTDLHLFGDQEKKLVGINPLQALQQVIARASQDMDIHAPDLVVLTGDVSQDFSMESYKIASKIFKNFQCPVATTMGNHDYLLAFTKTFGSPTQLLKKFAASDWNILVINSHREGHVDGQLSDSELGFLQKSLDKNPKNPTVVFIHHHILPIDSYWIDKINLCNANAFLEVIDQYKNIKAVICGHVHQDSLIDRRNVMYISTPSTSWQFAPKSHNFKLDITMPGYRWINLHGDGTIDTDVVRIDHNDLFVPDMDSKGY